MSPTVGETGALGITLRSYDPTHIRCSHRQQEYTNDINCNRLLGGIPTDVSPPRRWGPRSQSGVDMILPSGWQNTREYFSCFLYLIFPPLDTSFGEDSEIKTLKKFYL